MRTLVNEPTRSRQRTNAGRTSQHATNNQGGAGIHSQARFATGQPSDGFEREADRLADQVMQMPEPQLRCACGGGCPKCQAGQTQFARKPLQAARVEGNGPGQIEVPALVGDVLRSNGQSLDEQTRAFFEPRFGHDFSHVRVHTGPLAARSAEAVSAQAYTIGSNVVFGAGRYTPESHNGRRLLAHELTHVVQQNRLALSNVIQRQPLGQGNAASELNDERLRLARAGRCPTGACHAPTGTRKIARDYGRRFTPGDYTASQAINVFAYLPDADSKEFGAYLLKGYTKQVYGDQKLNYVVPIMETPYIGQSEIVGYVLRYGTDNLGWRVTVDRYGKIVHSEIAEAPVESEGLGPLEWLPLVGVAARGGGMLVRGAGRMIMDREATHIGAGFGEELVLTGERRVPWFNPPREVEMPGMRGGFVPNNCVSCVTAVEKTRLTKALWTEEQVAAEFGETSNLITGSNVNLQSAKDYFTNATGKQLSPNAFDLGANRLTPGNYLVFGGESTNTLKHVVRATVKQDGRLVIYDPQIAAKPTWFQFLGKWGRGSRAYRIDE